MTIQFTEAEAKVYNYMMENANEADGTFVMSGIDMEFQIGLSVATIWRARKKMVQLGVIEELPDVSGVKAFRMLERQGRVEKERYDQGGYLGIRQDHLDMLLDFINHTTNNLRGHVLTMKEGQEFRAAALDMLLMIDRRTQEGEVNE